MQWRQAFQSKRTNEENKALKDAEQDQLKKSDFEEVKLKKNMTVDVVNRRHEDCKDKDGHSSCTSHHSWVTLSTWFFLTLLTTTKRMMLLFEDISLTEMSVPECIYMQSRPCFWLVYSYTFSWRQDLTHVTKNCDFKTQRTYTVDDSTTTWLVCVLLKANFLLAICTSIIELLSSYLLQIYISHYILVIVNPFSDCRDKAEYSATCLFTTCLQSQQINSFHFSLTKNSPILCLPPLDSHAVNIFSDEQFLSRGYWIHFRLSNMYELWPTFALQISLRISFENRSL